jgi:hypothetical protein
VDGLIVSVSASGFRFFEIEVAAFFVNLNSFKLGSVRFYYKLRLKLLIEV